MIVVDASALVAVYLGESDRDELVSKLKRTYSILMSPIGLWETLVRAAAVNGPDAHAEVEALIVNFGVVVVPADEGQARLAAEVSVRYGKRTPAKLNLGDCFAYALAKQRNAPLLYKGEDFTHTDITAA